MVASPAFAAFVPIPDFDSRWNPDHTRLKEANAGDATRAAGMVGTDRWMVPEAGLWGAGGRLALENVRKW